MSGTSGGLGTPELMLIEQRVSNETPSVLVAYLLWFFLRILSGHRFYLGKVKSAILQIILNCMLIGLIWTFIDAFLIPGMIRQDQAAIRDRLIRTATVGLLPR